MTTTQQTSPFEALRAAFDRSQEGDDAPLIQAPLATRPAFAGILDVTHARAARVEERCNFEVTGLVLTHRGGLEKKAIVEGQSVRWFPNLPEFSLMMTGSKVTPGPGIQPAEADGDDLLGRSSLPLAEQRPAGPVSSLAPTAPSRRPLLTAPPSARLLESTEEALGVLAGELGCVRNEDIPHNAGWFVPGKATAYASALDAIKGLVESLKNGGTVYYPAPAAVVEEAFEAVKAEPPKKVIEPAPETPQGALF
jgi:hypothetical protein